MSTPESRRFPKGMRLIARGPDRINGTPDVDGIIIGVRPDDGMVLVKEKHWDTPTVLNPNGGWFLLKPSLPDTNLNKHA
jgi:hypothetical protein